MKLKRPIIFFDLETTGVEISTSRVVQIACIKINIDGYTDERNILINPTIPIPKEATEVHNITDEMVKDAPFFSQMAKSIYSFFKDCDIAGYNSDSYDVPLLCEEFNRVSMVFLDWDYNLVDVLKYERLLRPNKLADVYKRYTGKELEGSHNAINDVKATVEILFAQIEGKEEITPAEIDDFCQSNKKRFDVAGKTYMGEDNVVYWSFGKNMNKPILQDMPYLEWVLKSDFPSETKYKIRQILNK
jgi:DNA polymerase-3 subunit epsilon